MRNFLEYPSEFIYLKNKDQKTPQIMKILKKPGLPFF